MINFCPLSTPITARRALKNALQAGMPDNPADAVFFYSPRCDRPRYLRSPGVLLGPGAGRSDRGPDWLRPGQHLRPVAELTAAEPVTSASSLTSYPGKDAGRQNASNGTAYGDSELTTAGLPTAGVRMSMSPTKEKLSSVLRRS